MYLVLPKIIRLKILIKESSVYLSVVTLLNWQAFILTEVYFIVFLIAITDGTILFCKYLLDKPNILDKELNADLIIGSYSWDYLALPIIFIFPFVWMLVWTQENPDLYLLPFVITFILTAGSLILLVKYRFNRYYLTDKGIVILNLLTKKHLTLAIDKVKGYSYRQGYRSSPNYLVATSQKNINFSVKQIKNIPLFKEYFKKHNIPYYEYDWLTGNDYKK